MNVSDLLAERPIAYHRPLIRKFGIVPGIFLGQLLFWQGKGSKGKWIYKTQAEMKDETCLSRRNQETARKKLIDKGIIEEKLMGVPAQLHYKVNLEELTKCLGLSSMAESANSVCANRANSDGGTSQSITKNTQETTTRREPPPPAIEMVHLILGRYPKKVLWPQLVKILGDCPARAKLERCFNAWILRDYNPMNLSWITEWYIKGIPANGNRLPTQAEMNRGGTGHLVL